MTSSVDGSRRSIPHLLIPVVTDPKHASTALKWAVREMEQRYKKLASVGVRRVSTGSLLASAAYGALMSGARELLTDGTSHYAERGVSPEVLRTAFG